jgi:Swt1-like HEPN
MQDAVYAFVFKRLLAEEALDKAGRLIYRNSGFTDAETEKRLSLHLLDEDMVARARKMAAVYTAIAAFENSVRELITKKLLEVIGEDWWVQGVSAKIREKAQTRCDEEEKIRWHTRRGSALIDYTEFGDLASIINQNWDNFKDHLHNLEWVRQIIDTLERSRNLIMHSELGNEDIERIGIVIRDWVKQVGA